LNEIPHGAYLCIAIDGKHGEEGAYAAIRIDGKPTGAPDRSVSYPADVWEFQVAKMSTGYTYYVPLTPDMIGKPIDAVVLKNDNDPESSADLKPEVWLTATPAPYETRDLVLTR
jgi:hypothetical protein